MMLWVVMVCHCAPIHDSRHPGVARLVHCMFDSADRHHDTAQLVSVQGTQEWIAWVGRMAFLCDHCCTTDWTSPFGMDPFQGTGPWTYGYGITGMCQMRAQRPRMGRVRDSGDSGFSRR